MSGWDEFARARREGNVHTLPLRAMPARLPHAEEIPPREWLYGSRLIRRFVTLLVAPGGAGKSSYNICVACELASGRSVLGERIHHRVNAWLLSLEDPIEETERRIAAVMLRHGIKRDELAGRLFVNCGRDRRIVMAQLNSDDGYSIVYPDKDAILAAITENGIGYISVDPFVKSHQLEENRNEHMDAAASAWAEVAHETGAAIELVHHTRKGGIPAEMIEAARGGKALTDAARVGQVLTTMSIEDAAKFSIRETERWHYIRLDDAKVNMAPRAELARWMRLELVELGNRTAEYPLGDRVAAVASWSPPSAWEGMTMVDAVELLETIDRGPGGGEYYTAGNKMRHTDARWAGHPITRQMGWEPARASTILNQWLQTGLLVPGTYHSPAQRRERQCVRVDQAKLADMKNALEPADDDAS